MPELLWRKLQQHPKSGTRGLGIVSSERYSSHVFRRGAENVMKSSGSQWPTAATLGEWRSLAFRGYLGLTDELSRDMSKLLAETDPILSAYELEVRTLGAGPERCVGLWVLGARRFDGDRKFLTIDNYKLSQSILLLISGAITHP